MPYLNITAHLPEKPDQDVLQKKGGDSFPYVIFMSSEGLVLGDRFFPAEEAAATAALDAAKADAALLEEFRAAAKAKPDDKIAQANLTLLMATMQKGDAPAMSELEPLAKLGGVDQRIKDRFQPLRVQAFFAGLDAKAEAMKKDGKTQEEVQAMAEEEAYGFMKQGVAIAEGEESAVNLYFLGLHGAIRAKDAHCAEAALKWLQRFGELKVPAGNQRFYDFLESLEDQINELKGDKTPESKPAK